MRTRFAGPHGRTATAAGLVAVLAIALWACGLAPASPSVRPTPPDLFSSAIAASPIYVPVYGPDGTVVVAGATSASTVAPTRLGPPPTGPVANRTQYVPTPTPFVPTPTPFVPTPQPTSALSPSASSTPGRTVTIAAAGDIACDPSANVGAPQNCDQAATANQIAALNPTAVLPLGDIQYETGTLEAFQAVYDPTWGRFKSKTFPAVGNHEYLTPGGAGYFDYFGLPAYYSYDLGNWHFISLNSECSHSGGCGSGSRQETWLRNNLAANQSKCTLVYWHEPRWSSGLFEDTPPMATIWNDLVAAHVDVVLTGHNHDYERFAPLDANGNPDPNGVTEFVVGTGGKNHTGFVTAPLNGELVRDDSSFGVLSMALGPTSYSWRFLPAPGYSFHDSGSANCV